MAQLIQLILSESKKGKGIAGDPVRRIIELYTKSGRLVASRDTWNNDQSFLGEELDDEIRQESALQVLIR